MKRNCYRCGNFIEEPVENNSYYVRANDTTETVIEERVVERKHSDKTRQIRDTFVEEDGLNATQANIAIARQDEEYLKRDGRDFSVSDEDFVDNETKDPSPPEHDPEVVRVDTEKVERERQKTGIVCPECQDKNDTIIWGPDGE